MQLGFVNSITSVVLRVKIRKLSDGSAFTTLDHTTAGLIIAAIADNEAATTSYTVTGSTIETIATLGTFAAPTATKCRFKAVDATNHPGLYEIQLADARWAVSGARSVNVTVSGAADIEQVDTVIQLGMVTGVNWSNVQNASATVNLSGTTVADVTTLSAAQAEPGQGAPAANATPLQKIGYLFKAWRNKKTQTATQYSLYADDASTIDQKATVSDDATTTTIGEVATGP